MYQRMNEDYVGEMQKLTEGVVSLNSEFKMGESWITTFRNCSLTHEQNKKGDGLMGLLLPLRYILKLPSSELVKQKWNATLDLQVAIDKGYMTMLASSDLIRTLDRLKNQTIDPFRVKQMKRTIKELTQLEDGAANRRKLVQARQTLFNYLYLPDYLNVVMENQRDYDRANKGFTLNGIKYRRFSPHQQE